MSNNFCGLLLREKQRTFARQNVQKAIAKKTHNCKIVIHSIRMPEHCGTPPRGQGQFNFGNSTGTVLITGFAKMFVHEFGTKKIPESLAENLFYY